MKRKSLVSLSLCFGLFVVCGSALAHHGNAAYQDKPVELKNATVTSFAWSNPHSLIEFDVSDANGKTVHWVCETAAPQALRLIGWEKTSLQPGDVITIDMYQAKTGAPTGRLNKIVLADGSILHDTQLGGDASKGKTRYNNPDGGAPTDPK
jgi:Family of unknown function (DUF6152)